MSIVVVIPAYNEAARIAGCLAALAGQTRRDFSVLLVDNASTDSTAEQARAYASHLSIPLDVIYEADQGVGAAADTGFRSAIAAGATYLLRTDADARPRPDWVAHAVAALDDGAEVAAGRVAADPLEDGPWRRAVFHVAFKAAAAFGRLRPANRGSQYRQPYVMLSGNNVACTPAVYLASGGWPRRPSPTDREFTNALRCHSDRIRRVNTMVVQASTRRIRQYGLLSTARWYLDSGPPEGKGPDPR